jgi:hypothetical protein
MLTLVRLILRQTLGPTTDPPGGLAELGKSVWNQVLTEAVSWVSYKLETFLLGIVCDQIEERATLRELVEDSPDLPRLRIGLRELDKAIVSNQSTLGLTPTDRARLGFVQVKSESKLGDLISKEQESNLPIDRHSIESYRTRYFPWWFL